MFILKSFKPADNFQIVSFSNDQISMIERIIHFSIKNKFIVGLFIVALIG